MSRSGRNTRNNISGRSGSRNTSISPVSQDDIPPPPKDWTSHIAVKIFWILALISAVIFAVFHWNEWAGWIKENPTPASMAGFILLMIIGAISFAFWKFRAMGDAVNTYWDPDQKKHPH